MYKKSLTSLIFIKTLTLKYFSPIIICKAFKMTNSQGMKWYSIWKLFSKNTNGNEYALFPERKVVCIKGLTRSHPIIQKDSSGKLFSGNNQHCIKIMLQGKIITMLQ